MIIKRIAPDPNDIVTWEARPVSMQIQNGILCVWGERREALWQLWIVGTGWEVDLSGWAFVATAQDGPFVWHLYSRPQ